MEDSPAGKKTSGNCFVERPKKTPNPSTNKSTWTFGWDANKASSNQASKSNGKIFVTKASVSTTINPVFCSARRRGAGREKTLPRRLQILKRRILMLIVPFGITTPRTQARPQCPSATRSPTTEPRMKSIRRGPPPL